MKKPTKIKVALTGAVLVFIGLSALGGAAAGITIGEESYTGFEGAWRTGGIAVATLVSMVVMVGATIAVIEWIENE